MKRSRLVAGGIAAVLAFGSAAAFSLPAQGQTTPTNGASANVCNNPVVDRDATGWTGNGFTLTRVTVNHASADHATWDSNLLTTPRMIPPQQSVKPGEVLDIGVDYWVDHALNPTAQIIVQWRNAANASLGDQASAQTTLTNSGTENWEAVTGRFTVPANAASVVVMPQLNANTTGASWIATACNIVRVPSGTTPPIPVTTTVPPPPPPVTTTNPPPPPNPTVPPQGMAQSYWIHWNSTPVTDAMLQQEANRREWVLLNAWEQGIATMLKSFNPNLKVLVYKDLTSTRSYACTNGNDDEYMPTGVGYCEANSAHPDWFLTNSSGARYEYSGYNGHWKMDVGNVAYQNQWINNVLGEINGTAFDGVLMDNALFACNTYARDNSCGTQQSTNTDTRADYTAFLTNARNDFQASGKLALANLSNARLNGNVWNDYTAQLDGGWDEFWLAFSDTDMLPEYAEGWSKQMAEVESDEARGKFTLVQPHLSEGSAGTRAFRYTFASYLMANGGHTAFVQIATTDGYGNPQPYRTEYDYNLGAATNSRTQVQTNVWKRGYTCGTVVVNANATASGNVTVQLGSTFVNQDNQNVTSVSLPGTSGAVLRKTNCNP